MKNQVPALVGICGPARVGKDTFATALQKHCDYRIARFADTIKDTANLWFGWSRDFLEQHKDEVDERVGFSPRTFMQKLGTDFAREQLDPDIWVKVFQARFGSTRVIIPDVRFENEATWVRRHRGVLVHVQRADFEPVVTGHASEFGIERDAVRDYTTPEFRDVAEVRRGALDFYNEFFVTDRFDQE
jgi:hypothetical protein